MHLVPDEERKGEQHAYEEGHDDDEIEGERDGFHRLDEEEVKLQRKTLRQHGLILVEKYQPEEEKARQHKDFDVTHE